MNKELEISNKIYELAYNNMPKVYAYRLTELLVDYAEAVKENCNLESVTNSNLHGYHIETLDGTGSFNFLTEAMSSKEALVNLQTKSSDYNNLVKADRDLTIIIKQKY